jgi:hypothetical protein
MNKHKPGIWTASLLALIFLITSAAAQSEGTRIKFAAGKTSATVRGTVAKGGPDFYLVGAKAGQTMTVAVTGKVSFGLDAPGGRLTEDDGNTNWRDVLPADGDYKIRVYSVGGAQAYTLTVSITGAAKTSSPKFTTSGYFDGIEMTSKESGDYGGTSVFLTESDGQMFALVMRAEGVPLTPVLVEAKVSGSDARTVEFNLPDENGERKFRGTVSAARLTLDEAGTKSVLKRECGFLASNITVGSGGDYGGMEVFLTDAGGQWYALVTIAEGVIKRPVLVEADVKLNKGSAADKLEFTLPGAGGGRKFKGSVTKTGMTFSEAGSAPFVLKDKCYK